MASSYTLQLPGYALAILGAAVLGRANLFALSGVATDSGGPGTPVLVAGVATLAVGVLWIVGVARLTG